MTAILASCAASDPFPAEDAGLAASSIPARPNIVLIVVEDLGPLIGAFGDPVARTPNLDGRAASGIRYTQVFATAGVCAPSRAALITGMQQQSIGAQHMRTASFGRTLSGPLGTFGTPGPAYQAVPPPYVKAFPEYLRAAGYTTINNVKTDYQFGEPFTIWDLHGATASLSDREAGKPFFLMLSSHLTHESGMFWSGTAIGLDSAAERAAQNAEIWSALEGSTSPTTVTVPEFLPDTPGVRADLAAH